MYKQGLGPSYQSGLDENTDYTCLDKAELPVLAVQYKTSLTVFQIW